MNDNIVRLVQQVQDDLNIPKSYRKQAPDGSGDQKFVLLAFDLAQVYDTVNHCLLRVCLLGLGGSEASLRGSGVC